MRVAFVQDKIWEGRTLRLTDAKNLEAQLTRMEQSPASMVGVSAQTVQALRTTIGFHTAPDLATD